MHVAVALLQSSNELFSQQAPVNHSYSSAERCASQAEYSPQPLKAAADPLDQAIKQLAPVEKIE